MKKKSKNYTAAIEKVDKTKIYPIEEAIKLAKKIKSVKFDSSFEVAIKLNLDTKQADQQLRGALVLPNGTGKEMKVLVVAKGEKAKEAKEAGADFVGDDDMLLKIEKENWFDFDVIIATPDMMASLGKLGKILGPKGLMPNPKTGTITMNIKETVSDVKKGRVEYRTDSFGNIHAAFGKVSFTDKKLLENLNSFVKTIIKLRPKSLKGDYVKNISISTTMGPGIKIDIDSFDI